MTTHDTPRMFRGWLMDRVPVSGYWRASNYAGGFSPVLADTLAGLRTAVRDRIREGVQS